MNVPYGFCHCGCGNKTRLHPANDSLRGYVKGEPKRFLRGHNHRRQGPFYEVDANGCWVWIGNRGSAGYGRTTVNGAQVYAHRYFYEQAKGPIPSDLQVDHLCRNRACVNPDHLEAVTITENLRRGFGPAAVNARKTHCIHGHPLAGDNLYIAPKTGKRQCLICRDAAMARMRGKAAA